MRKEVRAQITSLGLASQADLDRIEKRIGALVERHAPSHQAVRRPRRPRTAKDRGQGAIGHARSAAAKKAPAKKKAAKKAAAKKKAAKKAARPRRPPRPRRPAKKA